MTNGSPLKTYDELATNLLSVDRGIFATFLSDKTGRILAESSVRAENAPIFPQLPFEKSPIPALVASILKEGETFFGKPEFTASAYERMTLIVVPSRTKNIVAALALKPETDMKNVVAGVRKILE